MDILAAMYTYRTTTYSGSNINSAAYVGELLVGIGLFVLTMIVMCLLINMALTWGVYKKGGYKGWEGIVPFYNNYCLYKMADVSVALFIISIFIPVVNIYMYFELAKKFGKDPIYGLGLFFLGIIFMPILGYGSAEYQGEVAEQATPATKTITDAESPKSEEKAKETEKSSEVKPATESGDKKSSADKNNSKEAE